MIGFTPYTPPRPTPGVPRPGTTPYTPRIPGTTTPDPFGNYHTANGYSWAPIPGRAPLPGMQNKGGPLMMGAGQLPDYQPSPLPMAPQPLSNYFGMPGQYQTPLTQSQVIQQLQQMAVGSAQPIAGHLAGAPVTGQPVGGTLTRLGQPQYAGVQSPYMNPAFQTLSPAQQQAYLIQHMFQRDVNGRMPGAWDYQPPQQTPYMPPTAL